MRIKIGDKFYDPNEVPIMLVLNKEDKENIAGMGERSRICFCPDTYDAEDVKKWMEES